MSITGIREQRIYTLLAIVGFFILFNILKRIINTWDMMQYKRIMACHKFWKINVEYIIKNDKLVALWRYKTSFEI